MTRLLLGERCSKLLAGALLLSFSAYAFGQPTVTVGDSSGPQGSSIVVTLGLDNPVGNPDTEATALNFDILFDHTVFPNVDLSDCNGNDAGPGGVTCTNPSDGRIVIFIGTFPTNPVGSGQFASLSFDVDANAELDDYELTLANWNFSNAAGNEVIPAAMNNGTISVVEVTAVLDVQPASLNFGSVLTGSTSAPQSITIFNAGTDEVDLSVSSINVSGSFALVAGGTCPGTLPFELADGEQCSQFIEFSPVSDGPASGTVVVGSDAGEVDNASVSLSGIGVPPPVELAIVQSPDYAVVQGPVYGDVVIHVLDTNGDLFADDSTTVVEMLFANDPSGIAGLSGTTILSVSNGVAVFNDLSIDQVGSGFELRAIDQSGTLSSADSAGFDVLPLELFQDRFED